MPFYGGTRRTLLYAPTSGVLLPRVGPFATLGRVSASSQPNILTTGSSLINSSRTSPFKANALQFQGFNQPDTSTSGLALFFWANVLSFPVVSVLIAPGSAGIDGTADCVDFIGGNGGSGASGGGGGGTIAAGVCGSGVGGDGGTFFDGGSGNAYSGGTPGLGGTAYPGPTAYNLGFTYGSGTNGTNSPILPDGFAGQGGNGFGGGGAGGTAFGGCDVGAAGGGGGGGGLVCIVANQVIGLKGFIDVSGGDGGSPWGAAETGWQGGDGVFYMAAKAYDGNLSVTGNAYIWEIKRDGSLVSRTAADSWNNL